MAAYTVHEPPAVAGTGLERADSLVFVKDGFSWGAFLFGPLYFLARAEWLSLGLYIVAALVLAGLLSLAGASDDWIGWVLTLLNVIAGFEASELKRWSLARAGWREVGSVSGSRDEAERRFFDAWLSSVQAVTPAHERHDPPRGAAWLGDARERAGAAVHRLSASLRSKLVPKI